MITILLNTVDSVKKFANVTLRCKGDVTVKSAANTSGVEYVVDGKSLLGLFSLNLSEPVKVEFSNFTDEQLVCREMGVSEFD